MNGDVRGVWNRLFGVLPWMEERYLCTACGTWAGKIVKVETKLAAVSTITNMADLIARRLGTSAHQQYEEDGCPICERQYMNQLVGITQRRIA